MGDPSHPSAHRGRWRVTDQAPSNATETPNVGGKPDRARRHASPCEECQLRQFNICNDLLKSEPKIPHKNREEWQLHGFGRAQRNIKSAGERASRVQVICDGWAFSFVQLPDGRKQILSILIPGDVVSPTLPFAETASFSVQALTDVHYCGYAAATLRTALATCPALFAEWSNLLVAERRQNVGLVVDLGARSADERVSHLILDLKARLENRGLAAGNSFFFPLSQRLIAAATALTPEHVSRVMGKLRKARVIDSAKGRLTILNAAALQRIGALNL
jgi:CRP-like cAMP-binding protein